MGSNKCFTKAGQRNYCEQSTEVEKTEQRYYCKPESTEILVLCVILHHFASLRHGVSLMSSATFFQVHAHCLAVRPFPNNPRFPQFREEKSACNFRKPPERRINSSLHGFVVRFGSKRNRVQTW
ncbi:hypothetical protein BaRGS_00001618 [Batillaria attramentaria]|uniref:Uncharacterized protein n=1 Tax=Batillaria attramentaria TaxID=370345 RepID=A0ABD0M7D9_9CAEN